MPDSNDAPVPSLERLAPQIDASLELRREFAETAADVDREGTYPEENMRRIEASRVNELLFRRSIGGASAENPAEDTPAVIQILKNLGAGESSTAQIWSFNRGQTLGLTGPQSPLPAAIRDRLLTEVRESGVRFCSPQAERYHARRRFDFRLAVSKTDGGVLVNGDKYFATGSPGAKYGHSTGLMEGCESVFVGGGHDVLFELRAPGVTLLDDWDNMGQRATGSGAIHFENVFVPDGWHWPTVDGSFKSPDNTTGIFAQFGLTSVILGIGVGCMDALVARLNERPTFPGVYEDTSTRYQIGRHQARLAAGEASLMQAADLAVEYMRSGAPAEERAAVSVAGSQAKVTIVEAVLDLATDMQKFLGGQSTSNTLRFDRFWRNARTLSLQDVMDVRAQWVGAWTVSKEAPPISWVS
ncbi:acyl-CoA dehydrogenase family protein [Leucobacter sp. wl10]|uniref:acyl-CoA dehydrogenase family protein n=1 Tax=Leucobacter sp. wl10 TaxID=2304677 RepID=UPI000E5BAD3B|nr:acyl-CoA dehydrogenase family protein [Leucobacter sp. wl10]RGE20044.1 hypothetical protein D1J51_09955 [Leucobacter sp. wl10]